MTPPPLQRYLVVDDLAPELMDRPIYVSIPAAVFKKTAGDAALCAFTMGVLRDLMKLRYYSWMHDANDVSIDGFAVSHAHIYPAFST